MISLIAKQIEAPMLTPTTMMRKTPNVKITFVIVQMWYIYANNIFIISVKI